MEEIEEQAAIISAVIQQRHALGVSQRELANLLMEKVGKLACVFCGSDDEGWRYIIGSRTVDLRKNGKAINAAIEGRGGGKEMMIQGRAMAKKNIIEENIKTLLI